MAGLCSLCCLHLIAYLAVWPEAAVSGADEALAYDSLKAAGLEGEWGKVLERVQRVTSLAFFFTMLIGAAVYDSDDEYDPSIPWYLFHCRTNTAD